MEDLEQFISPAFAMLPIEPAAKIPFRGDSIRCGTVAEDVPIKLLKTKTRLQQGARLKCRLFVEREEPATLMELAVVSDGLKVLRLK